LKRLYLIAIVVVLIVAGPVAQSAPLFAAERSGTSLKDDSALEDDEFLTDEEFMDQDLEGASAVTVPDPFKPVNRVVYLFNDKLYFWVLKPVALGYRAVVPAEIRVCSLNFFRNLYAPVRFTNCLLQGKFKNGAAEFGKFFINSTAGGLGLADIARRYPELNPPEEDFGQTLGYWGFGNGFYLVLPVLGPSTLRDGVGRLGNWAVDPLSYLQPWELSYGVWAYKTVNAVSFRIGDYEAIKNAAIDPYAAFKDGYIQYRQTKVDQ
jgi:phospholipid-binding lipoprotein MlaA